MNVFLWVLQGLLTALILMPGLMKLTSAKAELKARAGGRMDWLDDVPAGAVKLIGLLELMAGIGLIFPQALDILPWLTPAAAAGIVLTMIGAAALHLKRKDPMAAVIVNILVLLMALTVAVGRVYWSPVVA